MELVLVGVNVVLQIDLNVVVHLGVNILTQETTNDCHALGCVSRVMAETILSSNLLQS